MAAQLLDEITWDGQALLAAAATDYSHATCRVPGRTIPALRFYSDIIGREIELARQKEDRREARPLLDCDAVENRCRQDAGAAAIGGSRLTRIGRKGKTCWPGILETWRGFEPAPTVATGMRT
jgi:hypothetical protein